MKTITYILLVIASLFGVASSASAQWELQSGAKVSFSFYQPNKKLAWRADTSLLDTEVILRNLPEGLFATEQNVVLLAWVMPSETSVVPPSVRFKLPSTPQFDAAVTWLTKDQKRFICASPAPKGQPAQQDIAIGVADGPWKTFWQTIYRKRGKVLTPVPTDNVPIQFEIVSGLDTSQENSTFAVTIKVPASLANFALRMVTKDKKGKEIDTDTGNRPNHIGELEYFYFKGDPKNLAHMELQTRAFQWKTLRAAHFKPN